MLSRIVWGALGVALCFVTLSGLRLWVRRRGDEPLWAGFGRSVDVVAYGLPLAMLVSAYGNFLTLPAGDPFFWTPWSFVIGSAAAIGLGLATPDQGRLVARFKWVLGVACLGLPLLGLRGRGHVLDGCADLPAGGRDHRRSTAGGRRALAVAERAGAGATPGRRDVGQPGE